jgi:ribonuclease HI
MLEESEYEICNLDITVHAEKPMIASEIPSMKSNIADDLGCPVERINIKATTWEGLGYVGRGEGIAADAVVLLRRRQILQSEKFIKNKKQIESTQRDKDKSLFDSDEPMDPKVRTKGTIVIYTDGASKGNPGPSGAGAVITDTSGNVLREISMFLGTMTNNQAEYQALILALKEAAGLRPEKLIIKSDSQLMVKQISGEYKVKDAELISLFNLVQHQLRIIKSWEIDFIPRDENSRADKLANEAITGR